MVLAVSAIETGMNKQPTAGMYHYVVKLNNPYSFTGFMQHLVINLQAGVTTDMTTECTLDSSATTAAASPIRAGAVFSSVQANSQSYLRFYNNGTGAGTATVTLRDGVSGLTLGQWNTPSIPAGSEQQFSIANIETAAGSFTKPSYYTISVQTSMKGYFHHVLWRSADGTLTNLSTCGAGVTANPSQLDGVHSSLLAGAYPSSIVVNNNGAAAQTVALGIYDARDGTKIGTYTTASIPAAGQVNLPVTTIENRIGKTPTTGMYHYVIKAEGAFAGFLQNLVTNKQAGVITDMTTGCALN